MPDQSERKKKSRRSAGASTSSSAPTTTQSSFASTPTVSASSTQAPSSGRKKQASQQPLERQLSWRTVLQTNLTTVFGTVEQTKDQDSDGLWYWLTQAQSGSGSSSESENMPQTAENKEKQAAIDSWAVANRLQAMDLTRRDYVALLAIAVVAFGVRFWRISWPDEVVYNEAQTIKRVSQYLTNEYFFDTQPPLAKLMLAKVGSLMGFNGTFELTEIGDQYPGWVPFVSMRAMMALMGTLVAPMAFVTLKASGQGTLAALTASSLVTFDNALTTANRLVLLEGPLLFFTAGAVMAWTLFLKQSSTPFGNLWYGWMLATGLFVGAAMSTKTLGLLCAVAIALSAAIQVWNLALEETMTFKTWAKHATSRAALLLGVPMAVYMAIYSAHFDLLTKVPSTITPEIQRDLHLMNPALRYSLKDESVVQIPASPPKEIFADLAYGSIVSLRSEFDTGVFLHSFARDFPTGSKQQQVGGTVYEDVNTEWQIVLADLGKDNFKEVPTRLQYVKNGDVIRLRHVSTGKCLHSHGVRLSNWESNKNLNEVSAYGSPAFDGDSNDWWVVEAMGLDGHPLSRKVKSRVNALSNVVRLVHVNERCSLLTTDSLMPDGYGLGRQEIMCRKEATVTKRSTWRFVQNTHPNLPIDADLAAYPTLSFLQKLRDVWRLNYLEGKTENNGHIDASSPISWPFLRSSIPAWSDYRRQVTLLGNPAVWWGSTLGLVGLVLTSLVFLLREKRGYKESGLVAQVRDNCLNQGVVFAAFWAIHFVPYIFMPRTFFATDYFPALYFAILASSSFASSILSLLPQRSRVLFAVLVLSAVVHIFALFGPLSYGSLMSREDCESLKWIKGWQLDCKAAPYRDTPLLQLSTLKKFGVNEKILQRTVKAQPTPGVQALTKDENQALPKLDDHSAMAQQAKQRRRKRSLPDGDEEEEEEEELVFGRNRIQLFRSFPRKKQQILPLNLPNPKMASYLDRKLQEQEQKRNSGTQVEPQPPQQQQQEQQQQPAQEAEALAEAAGPQKAETTAGANVHVSSEEELAKVLAEYKAKGIPVRVERKDKNGTVLKEPEYFGHGAGSPEEIQARHEAALAAQKQQQGAPDVSQAQDVHRNAPISVGSNEELEVVLANLKAKGIVAEVVRGTKTEIVKPVQTPAEQEQHPQAEEMIKEVGVVTDEQVAKEEQLQQPGVAVENSENSLEVAQESEVKLHDQEEQAEVANQGVGTFSSPPVMVRSPEELAQVIKSLHAQGIVAEVVQNGMTETIVPEPTPGIEGYNNNGVDGLESNDDYYDYHYGSEDEDDGDDDDEYDDDEYDDEDPDYDYSVEQEAFIAKIPPLAA